MRLVLGGVAFSSVTLLVLPSALETFWPACLVVGGCLSALATNATRDAGRRPLGTFLATLGYIFICVIVAVLLAPAVYAGDLPSPTLLAISVLPMSLWLFLSSRAGRRRREEPNEYADVFE